MLSPLFTVKTLTCTLETRTSSQTCCLESPEPLFSLLLQCIVSFCPGVDHLSVQHVRSSPVFTGVDTWGPMTDLLFSLCRYQSVLSACCLRPDLALLPNADLTEVTSLPF